MIGADARHWRLFRAAPGGRPGRPAATKQNGRNPDPFDESAFRPSGVAGHAARQRVTRPCARR
ncbi:hypothetical protein DIE18_22240 [Burkholderia sp. Bp9125]|nr:hypothetical protein DIE18_22240 [Burkholderia sp. Bp9125]